MQTYRNLDENISPKNIKKPIDVAMQPLVSGSDSMEHLQSILHQPTAVTPAAVDQKDYKDDKQPPTIAKKHPAVAIVKHMSLFADSEGWISKQSIRDACVKKLRASKEAAHDFGKHLFFMAAYQGVTGTHKKHSLLPLHPGNTAGKFKAEDINGKFHLPHDLGFYNQDGEFDEKLFDSLLFDPKENLNKPIPVDKILVDRDMANKDIRIIFISSLERYMQKNRRDIEESEWKNASSIFREIGKKLNKEEIQIIADTPTLTVQRLNKNVDFEYCLRVDDLKAYLKDTQKFLDERTKDGRLIYRKN
jgi:hypothetical protein